MKYVEFKGVINAVKYIEYLSNQTKFKDSGAYKFVADEYHYDFGGNYYRCIHDLKFRSINFHENNLLLYLDGNKFKHTHNLEISYSKVTSLFCESFYDKFHGTDSLTDVIVDEILFENEYKVHEIRFQNGVVKVTFNDLVAKWI